MSEFNNGNGSDFRPPSLVLSSQSRIGIDAANRSLFDFGAVFRLLRRRMWFIASVMLVCLAIAVFLSSLSPNTYVANTRILLDEQNVNPFGNDEIFSDMRLTSPVVESQMQVIRSPYLLSLVADKLDLANNDEFLTAPNTPMADRLNSLRDALSFGEDETPVVPNEAERFRAAIDLLRDNLVVSRNAQTLVIKLQVTSTSPEIAAQIANAVAETYIGNRLGVRQDSAEQAAEWFDDRIGELNVRALETEQQMARLSSGGVEALDASQSAATLQDARGALQTSMAERARTQTLVTRLQTIVDSGRGLRGVPSSLATESEQALLDEIVNLEGDLAQVRQDNPDDTAEIERFQSQVQSLETIGASLLVTLLSDAIESAERASDAENAATRAFEAIRDESGGSVTNAIEVELRTLEGEARIYRELHDTYLESYLRTIQQQSFPSTEATIIEVALPPQFPRGPGLRQLGLLAVLIGLTLGAGGAFALEAADGRVRTVAQLTRASGAPFIGVLPSGAEDQVPKGADGKALKLPLIAPSSRTRDVHREVISLPENRISLIKNVPQLYSAINNPLSTFSETIRRVNIEVDNVSNLLGQDAPKTRIVGFVSDTQSQGRSVSAANYAEMLAVGGRPTLLIDLDWTGMFLSEKITPAARFGLAELASMDHAVQSEQAFWYDERTSLYFLPNRSFAQDAVFDPLVFDSNRLKALIHALSPQFDSIVLDLSPLSISSDAAAMAEIVSAFVAVADWGQTKSSSLSSELRRASIYPPKLIGTLLHGVSSEQLRKYETAA
jgi:succinoglycan biosynthesis transport protein ExoP